MYHFTSLLLFVLPFFCSFAPLHSSVLLPSLSSTPLCFASQCIALLYCALLGINYFELSWFGNVWSMDVLTYFLDRPVHRSFLPPYHTRPPPFLHPSMCINYPISLFPNFLFHFILFNIHFRFILHLVCFFYFRITSSILYLIFYSKLIQMFGYYFLRISFRLKIICIEGE